MIDDGNVVYSCHNCPLEEGEKHTANIMRVRKKGKHPVRSICKIFVVTTQILGADAH